MLMHSPVAIPSRDVAIHPTLAHTDTATVTSSTTSIVLHPSTITSSGRQAGLFSAFARRTSVWVGVLQVNTRLPHLPPSALRPVRLLVRRLHESCSPSTSLSTGSQVYLLLLHAARLIADLISRRDYLIYAGRRVASSRTWKRRCRCRRGVHLF